MSLAFYDFLNVHGWALGYVRATQAWAHFMLAACSINDLRAFSAHDMAIDAIIHVSRAGNL